MIIKENMAVKCRTKEEAEIYIEIASKEGWRTYSGAPIHINAPLPLNFSTCYNQEDESYPNAITCGTADKKYPSHLTVVEASDLFRNQLIARRIRREKETT